MYIFLNLYLAYLGFILSISIYRRWEQGKLNLVNKIIFAPIITFFSLLDIVFNYTLFSLILGFPSKHDYTITKRLTTYRLNETNYKRKLADVICDKLLNPVDPFDQHC